MILEGLRSVISIIMMIFIGIFLTHKGWFYKEFSYVFSRLIINIALPSLIIFNLLKSYRRSDLFFLVSSIFIPLLGITISYILGYIISILINLDKERRGLFRALFSFSNTIMVGLPVNLALFGEKSVPLVTVYYLANTILFWTLGIYGIKKDDNHHRQQTSNNNVKIFKIKQIITPPLIAFVFVVVLIYFGVMLPSYILSTLEYMGDMTTPLSLFVVGINVYYIDIKNISIDKSVIAILIGKFIVTPFIMLSIANSLSKSVLMTNVFVIEAGMPVMATIAIVSQKYNIDYEYATLIVLFTIIVSLFMIPIYMIFIG